MFELCVKKVYDNDVVGALCNIAYQWDNDFSGENGDEYLWDCAKGYESNLAYVADYVANYCSTPEMQIDTFFYMWMSKDPYFKEYKYEIIKNDDGNITHIVLSYEWQVTVI